MSVQRLEARTGPVPRGLFVGLVVACIVFRLLLALLPGYEHDIARYKEWAVGTAVGGLSSAYEGLGVDYPPLFLYPLCAVGKIYLLFYSVGDSGTVPDSRLLTVLVKTPHLVFDLALAALLYWLVGGHGLWGGDRRGPGWGRLAALAYLWNPAVLWDSGYWGQPDGILAALVVAALASLVVDRPGGAGAFLSAAGLMKPLAAPFVPLLAWAAFVRRRLAGLLLAGLGGIGAAALIFLPFLLAGRFGRVFRQVLIDVEAMPNTSANAHNLWWLLGPWRNANAPVLGVLTPKIIGLALFGVAYAALMVRVHVWARSEAPPHGEFRARLFVVAAAVAATFFFLSTHLHENHLYPAVPLLLVVAGRGRRLAWLAVGCSVAVFLNCVLHDVELPQRMPWLLGAPSPVIDPHMHRPYTWLQLVGSHANSLLVGVVAAGTYLAAWKGRQ